MARTTGNDDTSIGDSVGLVGRLLRRFRPQPERDDDGYTRSVGTKPDEPPVVDLDDTTFEGGTEGGWTVVDFWAPWCGPCRAFHPVFDKAAREVDGVRFARCNVDGSPRAASLVGIQTIPTVVLFDPDGNEINRIIGVPRHRDFAALLDLRHTAGNLPT